MRDGPRRIGLSRRRASVGDADGGARKGEQNHWFPGHDFPSTCPRSDRLPTGEDPLGDIGYLIRSPRRRGRATAAELRGRVPSRS